MNAHVLRGSQCAIKMGMMWGGGKRQLPHQNREIADSKF